MPWKTNVIVVANVTATSPELLETLELRAQQQPCAFTLIVPATAYGGGMRAAAATLKEALAKLRGAGLEVEGQVGARNPIVAVDEVWDPKRHDQIIVSTLPLSSSKWLRAGLPERIGRLTGAPVTHIVSQPPKPVLVTGPPPQRRPHLLGPLEVLGWGGAERRYPA